MAEYAARAYGISLLGVCVRIFFLLDTRDATVHITLMMSFVVVSDGPFFLTRIFH